MALLFLARALSLGNFRRLFRLAVFFGPRSLLCLDRQARLADLFVALLRVLRRHGIAAFTDAFVVGPALDARGVA